MSFRNQKYTIVLYVAFALTWGYWLISEGNKKAQVVYINTHTVFNEFVLTKKLGLNYSDIVNKRKHVLDSMMISLKMLNEQVKSTGGKNPVLNSSLESAKRLYLEQNDAFEQSNVEIKSNYDKQIWNQLNQYIKEYGKEQKYDIIMGADGSGSLMYASDHLDVTTDVIEYVNNRFSGENK